MKNKVFATSTVLAALLGLAQIAHADCGNHTFTPVEDLPPEVRQQVGEKLAEILKNMEIDWDSIVVGLNEKGEITLKAKSEWQLQAMGGFSCLASQAEVCGK